METLVNLSPSPANDQNGPASAPTATAPNVAVSETYECYGRTRWKHSKPFT